MLEAIHADGSPLEELTDKAKDKNDPFRLMGLVIEYIKSLIQERE